MVGGRRHVRLVPRGASQIGGRERVDAVEHARDEAVRLVADRCEDELRTISGRRSAVSMATADPMLERARLLDAKRS